MVEQKRFTISRRPFQNPSTRPSEAGRSRRGALYAVGRPSRVGRGSGPSRAYCAGHASAVQGGPVGGDDGRRGGRRLANGGVCRYRTACGVTCAVVASPTGHTSSQAAVTAVGATTPVASPTVSRGPRPRRRPVGEPTRGCSPSGLRKGVCRRRRNGRAAGAKTCRRPRRPQDRPSDGSSACAGHPFTSLSCSI